MGTVAYEIGAHAVDPAEAEFGDGRRRSEEFWEPFDLDRLERSSTVAELFLPLHLLSGTSEGEREVLSETAWTRPTVAEERSPYGPPWERIPWNGDEDAYREDLYAGMASGLSNLPAFAHEWLEDLVRVGYHGVQEPVELPPKRKTDEPSIPAVPTPLPLHGEAYPVRFENARQGLWLQLGVGRSKWGYRNVTISDAPLRTDRAILAALTTLEGRPLDTGRLRSALREIMPARGESVWDLWAKATNEPSPARGDRPAPDQDLLRDLQHHQSLDYVLTPLRHHRPGFDDLPREDRVALMVEACSHVNAFLESLRKLVAFLEYGTPGRRTLSATRVADRDVRVAVLKDVDGLSYSGIGEELGVPSPADFHYKGDHPKVRKMVARGREILERALGKEGWLRQAEAMRIEAERWLSLTDAEWEAELEVDALGVPYEEALRRAREEEPGTP